MDYTNSVSIIVTSVFVPAMRDRMAHTLHMVVTIVFIRIESSLRLSKAFDKWTEGTALCVLHHANTNLA